MILTPNIYATGKWTVKAPFSIVEDDIYVCTAIRSIKEIRGSGVDPFENYYQPLGLSQTDFYSDQSKFANIITLQSTTASTIYIPDTYILSFPDQTTIPYHHGVLSMSLGAIPDTMAFEDIKIKLVDLVESELGIVTEAKSHVSGCATEFLTLQQHKVLESARLVKQLNNSSLYSQIAQKDMLIRELEEHNAILEEFIKDRL